MKNYLHCWLILIAFLAPIKTWGQNEAERYLFNKKKYWELAKQPPSLKRDTLMILAVDSMLAVQSRVNAKNIDGYDYLKSLKEIGDKINWEKAKAIYSLRIGLYLVESEQKVKAFQLIIESERIFKKLNDYSRQAYTLLKIGIYVSKSSNTPKAIDYVNQSITIAKRINNLSLLRLGYNHKGEILQANGKFKEALQTFLEYEKLGDPNEDNKLANKLNIGLMYLNLNREREGLQYILSTFKILPSGTHHQRYLNWAVREELVKYYIEKKQFNKAQKYLTQIKHYYKEGNIVRFSLYKYQIENGLGNYKTAIEDLIIYRKYEDSFKENEKKNQVDGIKSQLELKEQSEKLQKSENEKLRTENERQNQLRWFLIALSAVGLLSTVYVFRTNKKLKSNNSELLLKNAEISEALLKGQTIERQRVALDLHDNLGSTLSALWLSLDTIDKSKMNEEEKSIHQNLRENLEKAYNDVRLLSHNLLPEEFEKQGLVPTLQGLVRKINKNSTIAFDLDISEGFNRVANKVEFELYSICLELVNNILKHSKATEAKIELSRNEKQIQLVVSDNGIGTFNNESDGKGMKNVKARVESLNGDWEIIPLEKQGIRNEILIRL